MKLVALILSIMGVVAWAEQGTTLNNVPVDQETTISIKKGPPSMDKKEKAWEVQDGTAEITGEPELMAKEARKSWTVACNAWKAEFKELNKENKILNITCNKPKCEKTGGPTGVEMVCESTGSYKIKVKLTE